MRIVGNYGRLFALAVPPTPSKNSSLRLLREAEQIRPDTSPCIEGVHENPRHDHLAPLTRHIRLRAGHCLLAIARIQAPVWYVFSTPIGLNYRAGCVTTYIGLVRLSLR
jgi:hypothetical protein